jgi:xanthine dehydrogenase accessory factor
VIDEDLTLIRQIPFPVLVEATLSKKNRGISRELAPLVIALGPGFAAGRDAHVVIETMRGHDLGRILREGEALPDTGVPGEIEGYGKERMLRAPRTGVLRSALDIGSIVKMGHGIGDVSGAEIRSEIDGVLRGLLRNGVPVQGGQKIGDVDPRGRTEYCFTISDKARAVAGGVLEAILTWVAGQ